MVKPFKREGSPFYYVKVRGRKRSTKKTTEREAQLVAPKIKEEILLEIEQEDEAKRKKETETEGLYFVDALTDMLEYGEIKAKRWYLSMGGVIVDNLSNLCLTTLTLDEVNDFVRERRRVVSDETIRRYLSVLSSTINWSIDMELDSAPKYNVVSSINTKKLRRKKKIDRNLTTKQFDSILKKIESDEHKRILMVFVCTGLRHQELLSLTWDEINFSSKDIEFGNLDSKRTKSGKFRRIPMMGDVESVLKAQKRSQMSGPPCVRNSRYVFCNPDTGKRRYDLKRLITKVREVTELKQFRIHDLRHTFASWLLKKGVDQFAVRDMMGHTTLSTTSIYVGKISDESAEKIRDVDFF